MFTNAKKKVSEPFPKEKSITWKDFKQSKKTYIEGHYLSTLVMFFYRIRTHKLRYFIFKPVMRLLHFDLIRSVILNGREDNFAVLALLFESAAITFVAFYFGVQISLFVFGGFGLFYTLIYAVRRISLYNEWKKLTDNHNNKASNDKYESLMEEDTLGNPQDKNYITVFIKKNYIALIAYLCESAAIVFTTFYFSLQISLFVFTGFSLFYTLIYAIRKIVSCCESEILSDIEIYDNNSDASSVGSSEEKIPLSKSISYEK